METLWILPPARDEALHLWSEDERRPVSVSSQRGRLEGIPWLNFTWRGVHKTDMSWILMRFVHVYDTCH